MAAAAGGASALGCGMGSVARLREEIALSA